METIDNGDFNYRMMCRIIGTSNPTRARHTKGNYIMKNNIVTYAAILGIPAAALLLLSFRSQVSVESIVGFLCVLAVVGVAIMEYRITWKWILGR